MIVLLITIIFTFKYIQIANNSSIPQSVVSGHHADMTKGGHKADKHKMNGHEDEDEVQIGLLEVQPR